MTCAATRLIIVAFAVGLLVSTISGSDAIGWMAAGIAVAIAIGVGRLAPNRFGGSTCPVPQRTVEPEDDIQLEFELDDTVSTTR